MKLRKNDKNDTEVAEISVDITTYWTYLLTPWKRVLFEKLRGFHSVKKFLAFYGIRKFVTAVTSSRHLPLSWASSIQFITPNRTSEDPS